MRCGLLPPTRYDFYPRPPRGGRPGQRHCADHLQNFYPRPPRGGRPATALHRGKAAVFLSTPSARRATFWRFRNGVCDEISIHALREEGDHGFGSLTHLCWKFLSTPSARRATMILPMTESRLWLFLSTPSARRATISPLVAIPMLRFLSTPSARRATCSALGMMCDILISIHALREEGDAVNPLHFGTLTRFLSTPSARRATFFMFRLTPDTFRISIHALREEGDLRASGG